MNSQDIKEIFSQLESSFKSKALQVTFESMNKECQFELMKMTI